MRSEDGFRGAAVHRFDSAVMLPVSSYTDDRVDCAAAVLHAHSYQSLRLLSADSRGSSPPSLAAQKRQGELSTVLGSRHLQ